jgi:hypothetical protein
VSAGQAEAYGKTSKGAMESFNIALGDLVEDVGTSFLPMMTGAFTFLREQGIPAIRGVIASVSQWVKDNQPLIQQVQDFVGGALTALATFVTGTLIPAIVAIAPKVMAFAQAIFETGKKVADWLLPKIQALVKVFVGKGGVVDSVAGVVGPIIKDLLPVFQSIGDKVFGIIGKVGELVAILWGNGKGPLATAVKLLGGVFKWLMDNVLGPFLDVVGRVVDAVVGVAKFFFGDSSSKPTIAAPTARASGGPVVPGGLYTVGEEGPETLVMGARGGVIIPASGGGGGGSSRGGGGGAGGGQVVELVINLDGAAIARVVDRRLYYAFSRASAARVRV